MISLFFVKCFLIGLAAASAIGPIFVLTFNSGATQGFFRGFFTAVGAALGDGFLLLLGLLGALNILSAYRAYNAFIAVGGGLLLILFGISMIFTKPSIQENGSLSFEAIIPTIIKTFFSTILNPITLFFFVFVCNQILTLDTNPLSFAHIILGSMSTMLGSLIVLSLVAYSASSIGKTITSNSLRRLSWVTGTIIVGIGVYFCFSGLNVFTKI